MAAGKVQNMSSGNGSQTISQLYKEEGLQRREAIRRDWWISGLPSRMVPCDVNGQGHPMLTNVKVTRHPLNDRHYDSLVREYADRFLKESYDNEDAGALSLKAVDISNSSWFALGGASRNSSFLLASEEDPTNAQLHQFIKNGGFDVVYYRHDMPDAICAFLVEELNLRTGWVRLTPSCNAS